MVIVSGIVIVNDSLLTARVSVLVMPSLMLVLLVL